MIHLIGPLSLWERGGGSPPVNPYISGGPGFNLRGKPEPDRRKLDREELRRMLEAAFADAPRDPLVVETKVAHAAPGKTARGGPRVDWSALLFDLAACARVLDAYAARIAAGRTMTQRGEKARDELRYSSESLHAMLDDLRAAQEARRARRRRAARAFALLS